MNVLVDTSVWSLALRRKNKPDNPLVKELNELIKESRVKIIGPIRQEILSGIRVQGQFNRIKEHLYFFKDLDLLFSDYERAAEFFNIAQRKGVQGSNTDFIICSVAERYNLTILTNDADFNLFQKHLPIKLHSPRNIST